MTEEEFNNLSLEEKSKFWDEYLLWWKKEKEQGYFTVDITPLIKPKGYDSL